MALSCVSVPPDLETKIISVKRIFLLYGLVHRVGCQYELANKDDPDEPPPA